jgi:DNA-binding transcriptional LysR family regulator
MKLEDHLDKLKAFVVIVQSGTLREASEKLNVTQPSLTRLVQSLEAAAGVKLLSRGRSGVLPTTEGSLLIAYASSVLRGLEDLEQTLANPLDKLAGHIRIGAYASLAEYLWPDFICDFKNKAPALRISIFTTETGSHQQALDEGEIDVLIDSEPRVSGDLISWNLYEDRFNFYMSSGKAPDLDIDDICAQPLIFSPAAFDRDNRKILDHLEANGYFFKERIELDSFMAVLAFAKKGLGLAVLPSRLAEASVKLKQIEPVALKKSPASGFGTHHFAATVLESRKNDPRIRFLIRSLKESTRQKG